MVTQYNYSPFGQTVVTGTDVPQTFRFTGREYDAETGLYYYRARYYSPDMRRFISEDPLRFGAGDVNWYAYVGNDPINAIDPLGLTRSDIRQAINVVKETQPDLDIPLISIFYPLTLSEGENTDAAVAPTFLGFMSPILYIDWKYEFELSNEEANDLIKAIIHEAVHYTNKHGAYNCPLTEGEYEKYAAIEEYKRFKKIPQDVLDKFHRRRHDSKDFGGPYQ